MVDWLPPLTESPQQRVLVIEDDPLCLRLFIDALELDGYHVAALHTDSHALETIKRWMPDVVLCDLVLHGMPHGLALIERLRADAATAHIPVILCSAMPELAHSELARLQHRYVSLLFKPFELHELSDTVAAAIASSHLRAREHGA